PGGPRVKDRRLRHARAWMAMAYIQVTSHGANFISRCLMKWAGMYLFGFVLLIGGGMAALWKLGILQNIETTWIVIGVVILAGIGLMISVANSGTKENIEIDRK